jgi:hypothetical protein
MGSRRFAAALVAAVLALAGGAVQVSAADGATVPPHPSAALHAFSAAQVRAAQSYWTPARKGAVKPLASAPIVPLTRQPAVPAGPAGHVAPVVTAGTGARVSPMSDGQWSGSPTSLPAKDVGVLYFTTPSGGGAWCTASVVVAGDRDLVLTAGHCVYDKNYVATNGSGWMGNYQFCPATNGGANQTPYGCWPGRGAVTNWSWLNNRDGSYDFGFVLLGTNSSGQHIADALGNQFGVEWNQPRGSTYMIFGYPGVAPYNGVNPAWCYGTAINYAGSGYNPDMIGVACSNMNHGASGGPWLRQYSFSSGWGYVDSVNSGGLAGDPHIYGSYFDTTFEDVYNYAQAL